LIVARSPPTGYEVEWNMYGDTYDLGNGNYSLNGNPGSINDFIRTKDNYTRPVYG
jgi:hypothetical protein